MLMLWIYWVQQPIEGEVGFFDILLSLVGLLDVLAIDVGLILWLWR